MCCTAIIVNETTNASIVASLCMRELNMYRALSEYMSLEFSSIYKKKFSIMLKSIFGYHSLSNLSISFLISKIPGNSAAPRPQPCSKPHPLFKNLTNARNTIAPTVAVITEPMVPVAYKPRTSKRKPPKKAPTTPTTKSPTNPNPFPRVMWPANQPATRPINRNQSQPNI